MEEGQGHIFTPWDLQGQLPHCITVHDNTASNILFLLLLPLEFLMGEGEMLICTLAGKTFKETTCCVHMNLVIHTPSGW